ncbi:ribosomal RNA processing protein 36 homolog [Lampris incognitus]|uniref:ribosomal RNA processing protein 36 homolog n=1 Tax=Lampris incognitus TaxID=2546036 RepID=UPI0024B48D2F|nr:ribosomal RNA processing protein 36 homolog [Lampris incognitus]XP_056135613.1 ribosomal RNA processing protein 36 homolog [Lampris incognitus]
MSAVAKKAQMKGQQRRRAVVREGRTESSSDGDSDVDLETNFALLSQKGRGGDELDEEVASAEEGEDVSCEDDEGSEAGDTDGEEGEGDEEEDDGSKGSEEDEEDGDEDAQSDQADSSEDGQGEHDIKKELSTMSFEDIMKLQKEVGTKVYNKVAYAGASTSQTDGKKKRLNKNRPTEVSAKRLPPFLRQVIPVKKTILRDPRFDDLSGEYKPEIFEKTYKFINDIKQREKEMVQKQLKKMKKDSQKKEKLQFLLKRMENQERARKTWEEKREKELEFKSKLREMAAEGHKPFFLKKSDKKKLHLADKYQELKKRGKLDNFLSKKRKRNATKDRRRLPRQQQPKAP